MSGRHGLGLKGPAVPNMSFPGCPSAAEYDEAGKYVLLIDDAHRSASSAAMELLRRRENLAGGLGVLKRYFLTAQVGGQGRRMGCGLLPC